MKRQDIIILKDEYKEELKKQKEIIKLLDTKSVRRYIDIFGYNTPKIYSKEEIMSKLLINKRFDIDYKLYINNGLYYTFDELKLGNWRKEKRLIKITDIDKKPLSDENDLISKIKNDFYSLESGREEFASKANDDIIINLPSFIKKVDNLKPFDGDLTDIDRIYDPRLDNKILRTQFFLMLMDKKIIDVVDYYSNENNWQQIDDELNLYKQKIKAR